jgi:DUF2917 family protein
MDLSHPAASIAVRSGQPLRLPKGAGGHLAVLEGHVWLTLDGDPRDVVLSPGEQLFLERPEKALFSALGGDARILRLERLLG